MALTTGAKNGDLSGCVEMTIGYFGYTRFSSGKMGITFDCTGASDENIVGKDPTIGLDNLIGACKGLALYVDYIQLSCGTTGTIAICDGSDGGPIVDLASGDTSGGSSNAGTWDFKDDPLVCLTADNTQSLCVSSEFGGQIAGFIKCGWGPIPK